MGGYARESFISGGRHSSSSPMAKKAKKKKVLALPVSVEDDDKVLLLEPGDEIIIVPEEELHPGRDEEPDEPPADEEAGEDEEATAGFADRLKGSLPVGGDDETEDADEPDEAEEDEPEETEPDDETGPGFADRLKAKLPIGGGDEPDEAEDEPEPEEVDEEPDEPPAEEETEPEPEADEPEIPVQTIDVEDAELDVETLEASGEGLTDVEIGDEPRSVTLDPIPYVPSPDEGADDRSSDKEAAEPDEPTEETEPVLDRDTVDRIRYNVDMAIYRTAKERQERTVEDPSAAVDEVIAGAETEPPEPVEEPSGSLPETDTRIETVPGIDDEAAGKLREAGVETITDLVERDDVALAVDTDLRVQDIRDWKQVAELLHVPGLEPRHAEILTEVGINRVDLLADQDPDDLRKRVVQYLKYREHEPGADLTTDTAQDWIDSAGEVRQGA